MILFDKKWINPKRINYLSVEESDTFGYKVQIQIGPTTLSESFTHRSDAEDRLDYLNSQIC